MWLSFLWITHQCISLRACFWLMFQSFLQNSLKFLLDMAVHSLNFTICRQENLKQLQLQITVSWNQLKIQQLFKQAKKVGWTVMNYLLLQNQSRNMIPMSHQVLYHNCKIGRKCKEIWIEIRFKYRSILNCIVTLKVLPYPSPILLTFYSETLELSKEVL